MPFNISEVDEFTSPVTVPEDGDERNAASVRGPYQALANRTLNLLTLCEPLVVKERVERISPFAGWDHPGAHLDKPIGWGPVDIAAVSNDMTAPVAFRTGRVGAHAVRPIELPAGSLLRRIRVAYLRADGAAGTPQQNASIALVRTQYQTTGPGYYGVNTDLSGVGAALRTTAPGWTILDTGPLEETVDPQARAHHLSVIGSQFATNASLAYDEVAWIELSWRGRARR